MEETEKERRALEVERQKIKGEIKWFFSEIQRLEAKKICWEVKLAAIEKRINHQRKKEERRLRRQNKMSIPTHGIMW